MCPPHIEMNTKSPLSPAFDKIPLQSVRFVFAPI